MSKPENNVFNKDVVYGVNCNESMLTAARDAAELLGFLSHHLRGRLPDAALIDMAGKADRLLSEIRSQK